MGIPAQFPDWSQHTLLVVEDYDDNFAVVDALLRRTNIRLIRAISAPEGLEILAAHPEIHVILMDITLPGMSGIEALHLIRKQYPNKVVIAQTAHSYSEKIANETFDAFIQKPVRYGELSRLLSEHLA